MLNLINVNHLLDVFTSGHALNRHLVLILLLLWPLLAKSEVTWLSDLGSINVTWSGTGDINTTLTGQLRSVNGGGGAQRYGVKGVGNPPPLSGNRFQLTNQVGDTLTIRRVRFVGSRTRTLQHNRWRGGYNGGSTVSVQLEVLIRDNELLLASPGDVFSGSINICAGRTQNDCDSAGEADYSEVSITVTIPTGDTVIIARLDTSVPMTRIPGNGASRQENFCLGTNGSTGVRLTASSDNPNGTEFRMRNGGNYIPYTVVIAGVSIDQGSPTSLLSSNSQISNLACLSDITSLVVAATELSVTSAPASSPSTVYSDTLMLFVEPE